MSFSLVHSHIDTQEHRLDQLICPVGLTIGTSPSSTPFLGSLVYDLTTNTLWYGNGSSWVQLTTTGNLPLAPLYGGIFLGFTSGGTSISVGAYSNGGAGTPITGTATLMQGDNTITVSGNTIQYTGLLVRYVLVRYTVSLILNTITNNGVIAQLNQNGAVIPATVMQGVTVGGTAGTADTISGECFVALFGLDTLQIALSGSNGAINSPNLMYTNYSITVKSI